MKRIRNIPFYIFCDDKEINERKREAREEEEEEEEDIDERREEEIEEEKYSKRQRTIGFTDWYNPLEDIIQNSYNSDFEDIFMKEIPIENSNETNNNNKQMDSEFTSEEQQMLEELVKESNEIANLAMKSAFIGYLSYVKYFVEIKGFDVNTKDYTGSTMLYW